MLTPVIAVFFLVVLLCVFYRHQRLMKDRAHLMREAVRNRDFTFRLPTRGLFFGELALQKALNETSMDIRRMMAQNEVEAWQKLTRVLTHEIMNATTPISSISQAYLANPKIKGSVYEEGIRAIHDTSTSLAMFVDSYRKLTKFQKPELTDVNVLEFVSSVKSLYPDLTWHVNIPPTLTLSADKSLMHQVFVNLVTNAIEAGAGTMDIRWNGALCVSNDGQPIPADVRREIFIPFFTTKSTGSGIGLSLSRQILLRQGISLSLAEIPVSGYHVTFLLEW